MPTPDFFTIDEQYFTDHAEYVNMLDKGDTAKQSRRLNLCVKVLAGDNSLYIPLRKKLGKADRKFGRIGFPVPSASRPEAGLDYRYMLVINDSKYLHHQTQVNIPRSQLQIINDNYTQIAKEATDYLNRYMKVARKGRAWRESLYKVSSLMNFNDELGISFEKKYQQEIQE